MSVVSQQDLEAWLWEAANILRGPLDPANLIDFVFPLVFLKRLSDSWDEEHRAVVEAFGTEIDDEAAADFHMFVIPDGCHWDDVRRTAENQGVVLQQVIQKIEEANPARLAQIFGNAPCADAHKMPPERLQRLIEHFSQCVIGPSHISNDLLLTSYELILNRLSHEDRYKNDAQVIEFESSGHEDGSDVAELHDFEDETKDSELNPESAPLLLPEPSKVAVLSDLPDRDLPISQLAELRSARIVDLFPSLSWCGNAEIDPNLLDERSRNSLQRRKLVTWGDLSSITVGQLWMIPNVGKTTVERILAVARETAVKSANIGPPLVGPDADLIANGSPLIKAVRTPEQATVWSFLGTFSQWATDTHDAHTVGDLLSSLNGTIPSELLEALAEVSSLRLTDVFPSAEETSNLRTIVGHFLNAIGPDARFVIQRHIVAPTGRLPTLESLGQGEQITRERVRQIISQGVKRAEQLRELAEYQLLAWRADSLRKVLGTACSAKSPQVIAAIEHAVRGFEDPTDCLASEFMLWFAGEYREKDGWWVSKKARNLEAILPSVQAALDGDWLLSRQLLTDRLAGIGIGGELEDADLRTLSNWRNIGEDWWVRWDGSIGDKVERVFRLALRTINPAEMNQLLDGGNADTYVQNVLAKDDRFTRVSMDLRYALTDWGLEEYSTASQEIAERIQRAGGQAVLADVVIELMNQFGLKEGTVRAYAASPAFVVTNGMIRLRREDEIVEVNDRVASAAGLYLRSDGCILFHIKVDADLLRGSGRSIPNSLAVVVGVRPSGVKDFSAGDLGRVRVSWSATALTGAAVGSTRALAEHLGAQRGDLLRLTFDPAAATVEGSLQSGSSLEALTGLTVARGEEATVLGAALGVAPADVRSALDERGDGAVAALVPLLSASPGLDEALSRLDQLLG
jgi:hypothetical protein